MDRRQDALLRRRSVPRRGEPRAELPEQGAVPAALLPHHQSRHRRQVPGPAQPDAVEVISGGTAQTRLGPRLCLRQRSDGQEVRLLKAESAARSSADGETTPEIQDRATTAAWL